MDNMVIVTPVGVYTLKNQDREGIANTDSQYRLANIISVVGSMYIDEGLIATDEHGNQCVIQTSILKQSVFKIVPQP